MDFIDRVLDHLESNVSLFDTFRVDVLDEGENALTIRRVPSSPVERFLDKKIEINFLFQIIIKNTNQMLVINLMDDILKNLEGLDILQSSDNSFQFIDCQMYSLPTFVEKDERGSFIYSTTFNASLLV